MQYSNADVSNSVTKSHIPSRTLKQEKLILKLNNSNKKTNRFVEFNCFAKHNCIRIVHRRNSRSQF